MQRPDLEGFPECNLMHNRHLFQPPDAEALSQESFISECGGYAPLWVKEVSVKLGRGFGNHGKRGAGNEEVPTSKYTGVSSLRANGLVWWIAHKVDATTGLCKKGAGSVTRHATEELAGMAVSMDRLTPGAPAPLSGAAYRRGTMLGHSLVHREENQIPKNQNTFFFSGKGDLYTLIYDELVKMIWESAGGIEIGRGLAAARPPTSPPGAHERLRAVLAVAGSDIFFPRDVTVIQLYLFLNDTLYYLLTKRNPSPHRHLFVPLALYRTTFPRSTCVRIQSSSRFRSSSLSLTTPTPCLHIPP
jgi:hypothetical protein